MNFENGVNKSNKTQTEAVREYLENSKGKTSARELFIKLQINSPRKVITKVRRSLPDDLELRKEWKKNGNSGSRYKVYWIQEK